MLILIQSYLRGNSWFISVLCCSMTQSKSTSVDVTTDVDFADTFLSRVINDDKVSDFTNDD